MPQKPKVFIGCSVEGLPIAQKIAKHISGFSCPKLWKSGGVFKVSQYTLESLEKASESCEYGIFVFTPDDTIKSKGKSLKSARDNVVFEAGLFWGKIGRARTFIVADKSVKIPTDMSGLVRAEFEFNKKDNKNKIGTEIRQVSRKIFDAMQTAPKLPRVSEMFGGSDIGKIGGDDELYSVLAGQAPSRRGVLISHVDTKWAWKLFPLILDWRYRGVSVNVVLGAVGGDAKAQRQEKYRRNLLRNLGVCLVEGAKIQHKAFCLDYLALADAEVIVLNDDTSGCHPFASRYNGREHLSACAEIIKQIKALSHESRSSFTPKIHGYTWDKVRDILKMEVSQYKPATVRIEKALVPTNKLFMISRFTRGYKYQQIVYWRDLYKKNRIDLFSPFTIKLKNKSVTIATPPIVEQHGDMYVVVEGNTRATYCARNNIKRFPCLLVKGVTEALPASPVPINDVLVSRRTLAPEERMPGFDYARFRHIERAMHPY